MAISRTRNYATVVYPESAPDNWIQLLGEKCVPCFISPIHDQDLNPTGEMKKSHYHVMLMFDNVKKPEQAKEIFDSIGGVGIEVVQSIRGYARYLCHLDNPEKVRYSVEDVISYGGADYSSVIGLAIDRYKAIAEMIDFCDDHNITSYAELLTIARTDHYDWFRILCDSGTYVIKEYLKSKSWHSKV